MKRLPCRASLPLMLSSCSLQFALAAIDFFTVNLAGNRCIGGH